MSCVIAHRIVATHDLCWFRGSGLVTFDDLIRHIKGVHADPAFHDGLVTLVDFDDAVVRHDEASLQRYRLFFSQLAMSRRDATWAIVSANDITYSSAIMAHILTNSDGIRVRVFRSRPEALQWLGLRPDVLDGIDDPLAGQ